MESLKPTTTTVNATATAADQNLNAATTTTTTTTTTTPQVVATPTSDIPLDNLLNLDSDVAINECMERLGTRLNMMETELRYAWRALDLLSQEYVKMWTRLEKLESLLYEQQTVITQLLDFYSNFERQGNQLGRGDEDNVKSNELNERSIEESEMTTGVTSELDALQEALKLAENTARESGLTDIIGSNTFLPGSSALSAEASEIIKELQLEDVLDLSNETFYKNLNKTYRDDFTAAGYDSNSLTMTTSSQLGMIWEEAEEGDENGTLNSKRDVQTELELTTKNELKENDVFTALDYKDYRNNISCVKEDDLAQLSRLNALDQVALEKLHELDRLTDKLEKDSNHLKELENCLKDSSHVMINDIQTKTEKPEIISNDKNFRQNDSDMLNDQTQTLLNDINLENWNYCNEPTGLTDMLLLANMASKQKQRTETIPLDSYRDTGAEMENNLTGYSSNSALSPRHKMSETSYASCSGRISSLMQNDVSSPKRASDLQNYTSYSGINFSPKRVINSDSYSYGTLSGSPKRTVDLQNYPYGSSTSSPKHHDLQGLGYDLESTGLVSASYSSVACVSPSIHSLSSGKISTSPSLSIISVRTKQDGFNSNIMRSDLLQSSPSPTSPPPPAPEDKDVFVMAFKTVEESLVSCVDPYHSGGGTTSIMSLSLDQQQGRLTPRTPHLPKSPKTSPKRIIKSTSSNLAAAKSDSGLSSMSGGWSSLEKSPGSPKSNRVANASSCLFTETGMLSGRVPCYSHSRSQSVSHLNLSPKHKSKFNYKQEYDPYSYSRTLSPVPPPPPPPSFPNSSSLIVGGNHLSAFTTVKASSRLDNASSPLITKDSPGTFVPSPAPNSDISSNSSKQSQRLHDYQNINESNDYYLSRSEKSSIYSVAGAHREPQNFAYASGSSNYSINVSNLGYPDLIGSYPISDTLSSSSTSSQYLAGSERGTSRSQSIVTNVYPTPKTTPTQFLANKTGSSKSEYGNSDGYNKTSNYRNSFPAAQITDALTYYPTNVRDVSMPENVPTFTHSSAQWLSRSMDNEKYFSSSYKKDFDDNKYGHGEMYTKKNIMDSSAQYRGEEGIPIRDYQWSRRDWNSELDIRNQNNEANEKYSNVQFYDTNGVIVSQSGYISIASNIREDSNGFEKLTKKSRKSGSLKSAMNSVSNWLPEIRFKRHRSNSLPAEEFRAEPPLKMSPKTSLKGRLQKQLSSTLSKKKVSKIHLVSTVSGIIQKAKKKVHTSHSLSDSEQSEMEWGSTAIRNGRFSALSCRSEDSVFPQYEQQSDERNFPIDSNEVATSTPPVLDESFQNELEEGIPSSVSTLFPTVGEIKLNQKSTTGSSDESVTSEGARKYSQVGVSGPPREFAVSRALGKFRQRQSSTVLDDTPAQEDGNQSVKSENSKESIEKTFEEISEPNFAPMAEHNLQTTTATEKQSETPDVTENPETSNNVIFNIQSDQSQIPTSHGTSKIIDEDIQSSPSLQNVKGNQRHVMTRHQVSLEIPIGYRSSGECDDDNRSTHSWRSTSRVSSRRQSTEDSIDSEDEWYCYELRKLEELEKQNQVVQKDILEIEEVFQPDENVKEKMSFVLKELKLKAHKRPEHETDKQTHIKGVMKVDATDFPQPDEHVETFTYDDKSYFPDRKPSIERRASVDRKRLPETPSRRSSIDRYFPRELPQRPNELIQPKEIKPQDFEEEEEEKEHSSGDTSGPDSPHQSFDEMDYEEPQMIEEESRRSSNGYQNKISGSLSREGSESVPPSEMSVSIQGEWNSEDTGTVREGSVSIHGSEWENDIREGDSASTITPSTQKIKFDIKEKDESQKEDGPKDGGVGSKWKLLKALKDRKAEEKEAKAEGKAAADETTTTVSKFY